MSPARSWEGPKIDFKVFEGSLGQFLLRRLQSFPQEDVIQVNGATGEQQVVGELLRGAVELAAGLRNRGVAQGDVVLLVGENSPRLFSVILATIFQNATLFPLSPRYEQPEFEHMMQMCKPKIIFTDREVSTRVIAALKQLNLAGELILLDSVSGSNDLACLDFIDIIDQSSSVENYRPAPVNDPGNEVVVILGSSGTTGTPKGIQLTHTNVVFKTQLWESVEPAKRRMRNLSATPVSWLTGFVNFITSCAIGFPRVYLRDFSPKSLIKATNDYKPEWTFMTPASLNELLNLPNFHEYDVSSMRMVSVGGSPLPEKTSQLMKKWPRNGLIFEQGYGITELSGHISEPFGGAPILSGGRIIRGMLCKVVDLKTGEKIGPNEEGELMFKSDLRMMKGYLNDPETTAAAIDWEGFYHSGDLGYITNNGIIYITGRIKDYIECRHYLISPLDLENAIGGLEGVDDVVVVGKHNFIDHYHIVAVVVKKPGCGITDTNIMASVERLVSDRHGIYGGVQFVKTIPRNSNGKMLRKKVAEMIEMA